MRRPTHIRLALLALVLPIFAVGIARPAVSAAATAAPRTPAPQLLSSDAAGASFVIEVPEPRFSDVSAPNGTWQRMDAEDWAWDAKPGAPLVPVRGVWLAVPEGARVTLEAQGEDARVYDGVRLLPQQALPRREGGAAGDASAISPGRELNRGIWEDPAIYGRVGEGPSPAATLDAVTNMRSQRVAHVTIRPVAYDPSTGRVRVWSRVRVHLAFEGGTPRSNSLGTAPSEESPTFERIYKDVLLNYDSGRTWRVDLGAQSVRRRGGAFGTEGTAGGAREDFTSSPNWLKLELTTKGVYRITPSDFATVGVNASSIDPRTLRVFVRPGVPIVDEIEPPGAWLTELAINVAGESDGTFDTGDYLLFVGLGSSGWKDDYLAPGADSVFFNHPYDTKNVYWVTWGGGFSGTPRRWTTRSVAPERVGAYDTPDFPGRAHAERDLDYRPDFQEGGQFFYRSPIFWDKWIWQNVTQNSGTVPFIFNAPDADLSKPARLFARTWSNSREILGNALIHDHNVTLAVNDVTMGERNFYGIVRQDWDTLFTLRPTNNRVTLTCRVIPDPTNLGRLDQMAMLWFDVFYHRRLAPIADALDFRSPDTTVAVGYGLGPFTQTVGLTLLDTSDPLATVQLTGMVVRDTAGGSAVYFHDDASPRRNYLAVTSLGFRRPDAITRPSFDDLKSPTNGADFVVLTYDGYIQPANALANYRASNLPGFPDARTRVVKISDVYNWYSGGRTDPAAIRNFFYDAVKNVGWSPAPTYVCILGDASFDFKNFYRFAPPGQPASLVPSYQNGWQSRQFMMDDWLVDLDLTPFEPYPNGPPPGYPDSVVYDVPDMVVGRIPANSLNEATFLVQQKILPYDQSPSFGDWRMKALFVADDTTQVTADPNDGDRDPVYLQHMDETQNITAFYLTPLMQTRKIFELEYPFGASSEKPAVNNDVKAAVNGGVALWNYIGHGNPFKMADENAFILSDVGALSNTTTPTLVIAASCDLGKFDDAVITGLGEALFKWRSGGAIGTISATDIAFAFSNIELSKELYTHLSDEDEDGFVNSMGEALFLAKHRRLFLSVNDNKYVLLGDPAQKLGLPREQVRMTLTRVADGSPVDTLRRGDQVRIQGEVHSWDPLESTCRHASLSIL